jgi:hypothetical protein
MTSRISFFATLDEQADWLSAVVSETDWCVVDEIAPERRSIEVNSSALVPLLRSAETGEVRVFLGRLDLSPRPVWRDAGQRREVDAIRSRAIHLVPCYAVGEVLIEGRMDILDASAYAAAGVDPVPLQRWYGRLATSLRRALKRPPELLVTESGERENRRSTRLFSPGAISWFQGGGVLKQFLESSISISPPTHS